MSEPAAAVLLEVEHGTVYGYATPVTEAQHLAYLQPLQDARQQVLQHALQIEPAPSRHGTDHDVFGNVRTLFSLNQPHRALQVLARSRLALLPREPFDAAAAPPWEAVRQRLRYLARARYEPAAEFAQPSPFVPRLPALRDYALGCLVPGMPLAQAAMSLMHRIHADFAFQPGVTEVHTPLHQVLTQRRGVCQDFAHLMLGALRMLGLAARYVSGYLLTQPPPGQPPLVGADASHAWVQVYCPDTPGLPDGWLDLDPTNDLVPDTGHVRLALGRDYGDVTPLRGVIRGGGSHTLQVRVDTRRVAPPQQARMLLSS